MDEMKVSEKYNEKTVKNQIKRLLIKALPIS